MTHTNAYTASAANKRSTATALVPANNSLPARQNMQSTADLFRIQSAMAAKGYGEAMAATNAVAPALNCVA